MAIKIKFFLAFNHILFLTGLYFFSDLSAVFMFLIGYTLIIKVGIECGFHRLFSHGAYKTGPFRYGALSYLGCLAGVGSALTWAGIHRLHHKFSDTDLDPHGNLPAYKVWLTIWRDLIIPPHIIRDLISNKLQVFLFRNYFTVLFVSYFIIGLMSLKFLFFGVAGASVVGFHIAGLVNTVCHKKGRRSFETPDNSHNNSFVNMLVWGNGLHNNHHANPIAWDYRVKKGEVDFQAYIIRWFLKISN